MGIKIKTGYKYEDGSDIYYGETVYVNKFNGIYDFEGLCKIEMAVKLSPLKENKGMLNFSDSYLTDKPLHYITCLLCGSKWCAERKNKEFQYKCSNCNSESISSEIKYDSLIDKTL